MAYVYRHIRLDKNEVFYIGIGSDDKGYYTRANCKDKTTRGHHWGNVVSKTNYEIEIILDNLSWEEACKKEIEFIALYGRSDLKLGTLVNKTDGGENRPNYSKEVRDKISEKVKLAWQDPEKKKKMLAANTNIETRKKISQKGLGRIVSQETRDKISKGNLGNNRPDLIEYNKKRSGKNHPYYGKSSPKKNKTDIKAKNRALEKILCPHCEKLVQKLSSNRWHFDKCKYKK